MHRISPQVPYPAHFGRQYCQNRRYALLHIESKSVVGSDPQNTGDFPNRHSLCKQLGSTLTIRARSYRPRKALGMSRFEHFAIGGATLRGSNRWPGGCSRPCDFYLHYPLIERDFGFFHPRWCFSVGFERWN